MKTNEIGAVLATPAVDKLITKREASELLSVCIRTIERLIAAGKLKKRKIGKCVRVSLTEVLILAGIEPKTLYSRP